MSGHVLVAPDKFKGSLTAREVAAAIADGLRRSRPDIEVRCLPVADGGDGTVLTAVASGFRPVPSQVTGPTGEPVDVEIAVDGDTAVVELASASGLTLLPPDALAPLTATSFGTGELLTAALDAGARRIVLGVGGSACTDGGAGMVTALGARVVDEHGRPLPPGGGALHQVAQVDLSGLDPRLARTEVILASDVDNPLLGPHGAARIYGPQKGAGPAEVERLDQALTRWSRVLASSGGRDVVASPGAGAAGGVGYAALAVLGARQRPGVDVVLELIGFENALAGARLVVTGEGAVDEQTLHGKGPSGVAVRGGTAQVPVVVVAGRCALSRDRLLGAGFAGAYALSDIEPDTRRCMDEAGELLVSLGEEVGRAWL